MCEQVSIAASRGVYTSNVDGCPGEPSVTDPSQLVKLPVSLLDPVYVDPALQKLYSSPCLHSGCIHLS